MPHLPTQLRALSSPPRWQCDREAVVQAFLSEQSPSAEDLLDVMLDGPSDTTEAAFECLAHPPLPPAVRARVEQLARCGTENRQVAWSLHLLASSADIESVAKEVVERALGMGGAARGAAIGAIPRVAGDPADLEAWLIRVFENGDESDRRRAMSASLRMSDRVAKHVLARACTGDGARLVNEALYLVWEGDFERDWTAAMVRHVLDCWGADERILLPALFCIRDSRLVEFEHVVVPLVRCEASAIAVEAATIIAELFPSRVADVLANADVSLHAGVRAVLEQAR